MSLATHTGNRRRPARLARVFSLIVGLAVAVSLLGACGPEAERARSGGPGGDIGNRGAEVQLHGQINPLGGTPQRGRAIEVQRGKTAAVQTSPTPVAR